MPAAMQAPHAMSIQNGLLPHSVSVHLGVRDAVVDAIDQLYLQDCTPAEAAQNFVNLACGATMGMRFSCLVPVLAPCCLFGPQFYRA